MEFYEGSFESFLESFQNHTPTGEDSWQHDEMLMQYFSVINASYFNLQDGE
ncbi:MAG: hypothetical protein K8F30_14620 [Taibaiella sp.]|nr:hypothetical protein [Taibaiella sp.]